MTIRTEHADVLIIGSGATAARSRPGAGARRGCDVVCLEQGGWVEAGDHPHYSADWQWQRTHATGMPTSTSARATPTTFPVDSDSSQVLMWNGVGGSTNVYGAIWPRFRPVRLPQGRRARPRSPTGRSPTRTSRPTTNAPTG